MLLHQIYSIYSQEMMNGMLDSDIQKNHARPVNDRGSVGLKVDLSNDLTADGEGFEPTVALRLLRFSRPVH